MKRIMALTALVSVVALFAFTSQAAAQQIGTMSADPASVPEAGEYTFTVSGAGFIPDTSVFAVTCHSDALTNAASIEELGAATAAATRAECASNITPVTVGSDGTFSVEMTVTVEGNIAFAAGDAAGTQQGAVPLPVGMMGDMGDMDDMDDMDDMAPEGGADTGIGGMAGSGSSLVVPLAAGLFAVAVLGGAAITLRRND